MENRNEKIAILIKKMGVSPAILGYKYINEALKMALDDNTILDAITKRLYPDIAKKFGTNPNAVERMIRRACEKSYENMPLAMRDAIFSNTVCGYRGKPTNSEFLATLVEIMTSEPHNPIWTM